MKRIFAVGLLSAAPAFALAAGAHDNGHDMSGMSHAEESAGQIKHGGHDEVPHGEHDHRRADEGHDPSIGRPGNPDQVSRTIEIVMDDSMRFTPDRIRVKSGETVRFFVRNTGNLPHEMVIGSMNEMREHAAMMRAEPHMVHSEPNMTAVGPGKMGGIVWKFENPGSVDFACLVAGHLEAGMAGKVEVE